jgi:hypothetical protein
MAPADDDFERHAKASAPAKTGYLLYPFQRETLGVRDGSLAEAGKLAALLLALSALLGAVAVARGDYEAFAAAARARSPVARLWALVSGAKQEHNAAQCVASWLSTPGALQTVLTGLACAAAVPLLLWRLPLQRKPLPRVAAATAKAALFYAAVWLLVGSSASTVCFLRMLMLNARTGAGNDGLKLRSICFLLAMLQPLARLVGLLELDLLPFVDLSQVMTYHYMNWTTSISAPFEGFFQAYLVTNIAAAAWRAPCVTLGATAAAAAAFAAAAGVSAVLCEASLARMLWRLSGGEALFALASTAAFDAAAPLKKELAGRYNAFELPSWLAALVAPSRASHATLAWLGVASVKLFGTGAAGSLALRGVVAAVAVARNNLLFDIAFQLARYRSGAALSRELASSLALAVLGAVILVVTFLVGGATDSDWVHAPCLLVGCAGVASLAWSVWEPLSFNVVKLL